MGLFKWLGRKPRKEEKKAAATEDWFLRWEYEENPPQGWRGLIFSPCPERAIVTIGHYSSSEKIPEEVTLTQMMHGYKIMDEGKTLLGEMGVSSVSVKARFTPELYREVSGDSMICLSAPDGSVHPLHFNRAITGKLRHKNVTRVFGWCEDRDARTFSTVHEPLADGTLYDHLHFPHLVRSPGLSWQRRYSAARDLAAAVHYLNEEYENKCIHMNISSQNVFLDAEGNAKLANLGVFSYNDDTSVIVLVMGTSYCTPMTTEGEKNCERSNLCAFGNVVLELVCGIDPAALENKQVSVWQFAMEFYAKGCVLSAVDPKLGDDFDCEKMERLLLVGLWCAQPDSESRASIKQAIKYLDYDAAPPSQLPMGSLRTFSKSRKALEGSIAELTAARAAQAAQEHPVPASRVYRAPSPPTIAAPASGNNDYNSRQQSWKRSVDDFLPVAVTEQHQPRVEVDNLSPVAVPDAVLDEAFDIGVPPGYRCSGQPLREVQAKLVESVVEGLREGLEREPGFEETLEMVRKYTEALVALGIPVGNWNALVQDILRAARLVERFRRGEVDGEDPRTRDLEALREEIEHCTRKIEGFEEEKGMVAVKQVELQKQVGKIQREMKEVEEELRSVETRKARETQSLDRSRKEVEMLEMVQSVLRKISEFTCGEE